MPDISLPSMVDTSMVGESTRDTALPWDRIQDTPFRVDTNLDPQINILQNRHSERAILDPNYNHLVGDIEAVEILRDRDEVSLNIEVRTAEREELEAQQLARENERRSALGLEPFETTEELDTNEPADVLLDQATQVVVDMASISDPTALPITGSETALYH